LENGVTILVRFHRTTISQVGFSQLPIPDPTHYQSKTPRRGAIPVWVAQTTRDSLTRRERRNVLSLCLLPSALSSPESQPEFRFYLNHGGSLWFSRTRSCLRCTAFDPLAIFASLIYPVTSLFLVVPVHPCFARGCRDRYQSSPSEGLSIADSSQSLRLFPQSAISAGFGWVGPRNTRGCC
jgi:hypothetical protein